MKILFLVVALMSMLVLGQKEGRPWWSITPLATTRAEVDTLLGPPTSGSEYILSYDTQDAHFTIWFGGAKSAPADPCKWNVKSNVVFNYVVAPKQRLLLSSADIDLSGYKKEKDLESERVFYYFDEINGITISTRISDGQEVVESIHRDPKLVERLKYCPTSKIKKTCD